MAVVLLGVFPLATYSQARTSLYLSLSHTHTSLASSIFGAYARAPTLLSSTDTHDQVPTTHSSSPTLTALEKEA